MEDLFEDDFFKENGLSSETEYVKVDICGLVKKMRSKRRTLFSVGREANQLRALIGSPPGKDEIFKMLSVGGGFSSLGIIRYVSDLEPIEELDCSTFRIGQRHFEALEAMRRRGRLGKCRFVTSGTQERTDSKAVYKGKEYNYYDYLCERCREYGWVLKTFDNHSKILLMRTKTAYYVVETSSNLNENPKMEQFSWENDEGLWRWYRELFDELTK